MNIDLINLLSDDSISRMNKVLLILFSADRELPIKSITEIAVKNGLREAQKWYIAQILYSSRTRGLADKYLHGWAITVKGKKYVGDLDLIGVTPTQNIKTKLREHLGQIENADVKAFVTETIAALEAGLLRSAVVLSWIGAISILYEETEKKHLATFNKKAKRKSPEWKDASSVAGLATMKEYNFLQVLFAISLIDKNIKNELENCLKLRNACSHPTKLKIGEHKVASHVEILLLNVYTKFTIQPSNLDMEKQ